MADNRISNCRSCKAPIYWLKSSKGKSSPINAEPSENGNCFIDWQKGTYSVLSKDKLEKTRRAGFNLHLNHFVTCPDAQNFR